MAAPSLRTNPPTANYNYTVLFDPLPEGGFSVIVPAIPEIATFGATIAEARTMAHEAIRCYLESAIETGEAIPSDVGTLTTEHIAVSL